MAAPILRPLTLGEILDVSFGIYRDRFSALVVIAAIVQVVPLVWRILMAASSSVLLTALFGLGFLLVSMVVSAIGVAASTLIVSSSYLDRPISAESALRASVPLIGTLVMLSFLTSLVVGFGFLLLIVPGFIFLAGFIMAPAAAVIEAPLAPRAAMSRSWQLSAGFRFRTLIAVLVPVLLVSVPYLLVTMVASVIGLPSLMIEILISVLSIFFYPFLYVVISVNYYDLRVRKEAFDLELMTGSVQNSTFTGEMAQG